LEVATGVVTIDATLAAGKLYTKKVVKAAGSSSADTMYSIGGDLSLLAVKGLTLKAGGYYDLKSKMVGFGAQAGFAMAPISIMFNVDGTDNTAVTTNALNWDAAGNLTLTMGKDTIAANLYADNVAAYASGLTTTPLRLDTGLSITDAEGIVAGLNASVGVYAYDLLANPANNPMKVAVGETISYKIALSDTTYVKPFETVYYDLVPAPKGLTYVNAGIAASLFPNTVITAEYIAGVIGNDNNTVLVATDMSKTSVIKITTKISY